MKYGVGLFLIFIICFFYMKECKSASSMLSADETGVAIHLANENVFDKTNSWLLANPNVWQGPEKDGAISFRKLKKESEAEIYISAFDTDDAGICRSDLILEIQYRDDLSSRPIDQNRVEGRSVIKARIDFSDSKEYVEAGYLEATGDEKWKQTSIFFERTPRQQVRAINGSFQFIISMPKPSAGSLAIASIRLRAVDHQEFLKLRELDRRRRGLIRIEYSSGTLPDLNLNKWKSKGFVAYPVNYLKLVFPNSPVDLDHVGKGLSCFEVPGRSEPVSFVFRPLQDFRNVQVEVTDLRNGKIVFSRERIDIRRVVFNDQRWGWGWSKYYGTSPDYLIKDTEAIDLQANINCQFWLTVHVPDAQAAGTYTGSVIISSNGKGILQIPLTVDVLPIKLSENRIFHLVFHSPFFRKYQKDPIVVLEDMKAHGLFPVSYPQGKVVRKRSGHYGVVLDDFEIELAAYRKVYPQVDKIFLGLQNYSIVWNRLNGLKPPFRYPFPEFESVYGQILLAYAQKARSYGFEPYFTFVDEPGDDPDKRRMAYVCSSIAQKNGLKTWADTYINAEKQLPLTVEEKNRKINYLRPLSEVLDVFVNAIRLMDDARLEQIVNKEATLAYYTTYPGTSVFPTYNRFLNGIYPFVTNVRYVFNYAYRDGLVDPYDDLDCRSDYLNPAGMNDYVLTYPTWKGDILPTLSYEALREGVEDAELISTLQFLAEKARLSDKQELKDQGKEALDYLESLFKRPEKNFTKKYWSQHKDQPIAPMEKLILEHLNNEKSSNYDVFDHIRKRICDHVVELKNKITDNDLN